MKHRSSTVVVGLLFALCALNQADATEVLTGYTPESVSVDLAAEIDKVAAIPERFAVEVPHAFSAQTHGAWQTVGDTRVWRYALRVPGAVSLSFHAMQTTLPPSATLQVTGGSQHYRYSARDLHRGELWSRIAQGDTLFFTLTVNAAEAGRAAFGVTGIQAGFRTLGGRGPNHPHYDALRGAPRAAASSCVENFECHVTSANLGPGQASVTLVIENLGLCSGVLMNDVPGDGIAYVLTARHCENGNPNGGDPGAASGVTAYFDATTPCGQTLGSIYSANIAGITGATTVVEQQDAWLLRFGAPVPVADAFYSGWDATGAVFVGGYTAHYGLGNTRQFTAWHGQAYYQQVPGSALGVGFDSTFWDLVNEVGSIAPGASGSGLFDGNNHLVGTVVRGVAQSSQVDSPGVCPVIPPPAPSPVTATGFATAFSGIFAATVDPLSTTGSATIRSVLDPQATGVLVLEGQWKPMQFSVGSAAALTGTLVTLTWNAPGASACTPSGGVSGDGWSGALASSGSMAVTEYSAGAVTYGISCATAIGASTAHVTITWSLAAPAATVQVSSSSNTFVGSQIQLAWSSTVAPCVATGGSPGDGWTGTLGGYGTLTVTEATAGTFTYGVNCGSGARTASAQAQFTFVGPTATLQDGGVSLVNIGQPLTLTGSANGVSCTTSGGASGDGWTGINFINLGGVYTLTEQTPGTYTYTLTCTGNGTATATASVTVTFSNGPPQVTLSTSPGAPTIRSSFLHVSWVASLAPCSLAITGYSSNTVSGYGYVAYYDDTENVLGPYTYTVTCGSGTNTASATTTVNWVGTPQVQFAATSPQVVTGQPNSLSWVADAAPCTASGGTSGDGWTGTSASATGFLSVMESTPGTYTYTITCGSGATMSSAQTTVTVSAAPVFATLTASSPTGALGGTPVVLTWNSNTSPCQQSGGSGYDGWLQSTASSGTASIMEVDPGTYNFQLSCGAGLTYTASAQVSLVFTGPTRPTFTASTTSPNAGQPFTLTWQSSDGSSCTALLGAAGDGWSGALPPSGSKQIIEQVPGPYAYQLKCGVAGVSQLGVEVYPPAPVGQPAPATGVQLSASSTSALVGQSFTLTWSSSQASSCSASGGSGSDGWNGPLALSGSSTISETSPGPYIYAISCTGTGTAGAQTTVVYNAAPTDSLSTSSSSVTTGQSFTLTWNSSGATSCTASGGSTGDGWQGAVSVTGSATVTEATAGSYTYTLTCVAQDSIGTETAQSQQEVTVTAARSTSGGGGGGGGGGGVVDCYTLSALLFLALLRARCRRALPGRRSSPQA